jgi:acylphosphatase
MTSETNTAAALLRIEGRVQGVAFRAWTETEARRRGLRGWVRNRRDGSVEALLIGPPVIVDEMADLCRRGPSLASVTAIERTPAQDDGSAGFEPRRTV